MTLYFILAAWLFLAASLGVLIGKSVAYGMGTDGRGCTRY